jgi:hypothetical protein
VAVNLNERLRLFTAFNTLEFLVRTGTKDVNGVKKADCVNVIGEMTGVKLTPEVLEKGIPPRLSEPRLSDLDWLSDLDYYVKWLASVTPTCEPWYPDPGGGS